MSQAQRLRRAREEAGFKTASDFARSVNTQVGTYGHHERGIRTLSRAIGARYAAALGVRVSWLLDGEGPMRDDDYEGVAAQLAREMSPEQRAAWFQAGRAIVGKLPKGDGGAE